MKLHKSATLQEDNLKIKWKALKHTETDNDLPTLSYIAQTPVIFVFKLIQAYHN